MQSNAESKETEVKEEEEIDPLTAPEELSSEDAA